MEDDRKIVYLVSSDGRIIVPNDTEATPLTIMYQDKDGKYTCEIIDSYVTMDQLIEMIGNNEESSSEDMTE